MKNYAVITGDLVSSRKIDPKIREELYTAIDDFAKQLKKQWLHQYDRFRGDSLQCTAASIPAALQAALLIRSFVMADVPPGKKKKPASKGYSSTQFDIRIAIGTGNIDFINEKNLSGSDGDAFARSGEALDSLKNKSERFILRTGDDDLDATWETIAMLLDIVMQKWTQNGAELVLQKLLGKSDDDIAQLFSISLSAVTQRKKSAQWHAIHKTILYFESKFAE